MDIVVQSFRRFKSTQMANAAARHNALSRYVLADDAPNYRGPNAVFDSYPSVKFLHDGVDRIVPFSDLGQWTVTDMFDRFVSHSNPPCDLLIGYSGSCLRSIAAANEANATTVVFRGAPHGQFFQDYLNEVLRDDGFRGGTQCTPRMTEREDREYAAADIVWTTSEFIADTLVRYGVPKSKLRILPWGVEVDMFSPDEPAEKDGTTEDFSVLYVGDVSPEKGVHYLLDAFDRATLPNATLRLVGRLDDRLTQRVEAVDDVDYVGWIKRTRLTKYYRNASVFVCPSLADGYASVVLEAMASGCPVVVTENVGSKDVVLENDAGRVVPPADVDAIVRVLEGAHRNAQAWRTMGANARVAMEEGFSVEDKEREFVDFFEELAA